MQCLLEVSVIINFVICNVIELSGVQYGLKSYA